MILLAIFINTLSCCDKFLPKNGYLRNSKILGIWNLDLRRNSLRMIMLLSLQVLLCWFFTCNLILLVYWTWSEVKGLPMCSLLCLLVLRLQFNFQWAIFLLPFLPLLFFIGWGHCLVFWWASILYSDTAEQWGVGIGQLMCSKLVEDKLQHQFRVILICMKFLMIIKIK